MNDKPLVAGSVYLPFSMFGKGGAQALKKRLSFTVKAFHEKEEDRLVETFLVDTEKQRVRVPFVYGLKLLQEEGIALNEKTLAKSVELVVHEGEGIEEPPKLPDPFHPLAPVGQDEFFEDLERAMRHERTVLAVAPTGSGKTAAALNAIGKIRKAALIVVTSKQLAVQWKQEIEKHLGWGAEHVGSLEEGKCFYHGKKIVIAVIHNVFQRRLSANFKRYFGIVVYDEVHRVAAEMFNIAFGRFPARVRVGLTATPTRKDGLAQVIFDCFGEPCVRATSDALPCEVRIVDCPTPMPQWRKLSRGALISVLTKNQFRNTAICKIVKTMYDRNRNILILSDRVGHLQTLIGMCGALGIPEEKCGLYTRSYQEEGKDKVHTTEHLERVRRESQVIFSTYAMGKEGMDIPRLDAGIDASPRADGVQAIGRIRRPFAGKPNPVWFTIRDTTIPILLNMTIARARDYEKSKATVKDYGTK